MRVETVAQKLRDYGGLGEAEARIASHAKPTPDERKSMPDAGTDEDILISAAAEGRQL